MPKFSGKHGGDFSHWNSFFCILNGCIINISKLQPKMICGSRWSLSSYQFWKDRRLMLWMTLSLVTISKRYCSCLSTTVWTRAPAICNWCSASKASRSLRNIWIQSLLLQLQLTLMILLSSVPFGRICTCLCWLAHCATSACWSNGWIHGADICYELFSHLCFQLEYCEFVAQISNATCHWSWPYCWG